MRAVVTSTYLTDQTQDSRTRVDVECDVILIRSGVPLQRVPVLQNEHGVNNASSLWIPRPSTRVVASATEAVSLQGRDAQQPPTPFGDLNGDQVLVGFIENDVGYPVILRSFTHEQTKRLVIGSLDSIGWQEGDASTRGKPYRNEHYTAHYGTEVRINAQGDMLIDTVGAFTDPATEDASGNVGQMRIRVKNSQRFTVEMDGTDVLEVWKDGGQVRVDLGEGATQRIPLGDDQVAALKNAINAIDTCVQMLSTSVPGIGGALLVASVLPAYNAMHPLLVQAKSDLDAALSDLAKTKKS